MIEIALLCFFFTLLIYSKLHYKAAVVTNARCILDFSVHYPRFSTSLL